MPADPSALTRRRALRMAALRFGALGAAGSLQLSPSASAADSNWTTKQPRDPGALAKGPTVACHTERIYPSLAFRARFLRFARIRA